jgi:hypothetical protein
MDHISRSRNGRTSGPVRAQGKSNKQNSTAKQSSHLDDAFEESNRPNKRLRQSDPIDLVNDDMSTTGSIRNRSPRTSPLALSKSKGKSRAMEIDEFRDTENMLSHSPRHARDARGSSGVSQIERFTEIATQQRRSRFGVLNSISKANGDPDRASRSLLLDEIEGSTKPAGDQSTVSSETARRSDPESPDELQGDVTTQPLSKSFATIVNYANARKNEDRVEPPRRKRSPTDIRSTDFTGSPQQGPKRTKRSHKNADIRVPLQVSFFRIGQFTKSRMKEETVTLHMGPDGLDISRYLLDGGSDIQILFRHVRQVLSGEDPSRKVRIKLSQGSTGAGQILDIEFSTKPQKIALVTTLQVANVTVLEKDVYVSMLGAFSQDYIC